MTKKPLAALLAVAFAFGFTACTKDKDEDTGEQAPKPADEGTAPEAEDEGTTPEGADEGGDTETLTLSQVDDLKITVPKGSTVGDAVGGEGAMIQGPNLVVTVEEASESRPESPEAAEEQASMYSPANFKSETLDDGWVVTFENEGSMGMNYFVNVRREIGDKAYWCETTASQPEQRDNAIEACKSLTK